MSSEEPELKKPTPDEVDNAIEKIRQITELWFSSRDRQMLNEILERTNKIESDLELIKHKLGMDSGPYRKFENSNVEWTFAETPEGKPVEEFKSIMAILDQNPYGLWVQIGNFEYRWSGPKESPRRFIHRRVL